ncbi:unnamed protein product [Dovyalis caffra]|uniref:Uncharacterized protein n=1 Tax=Dovyalis caffra TaxID=77055 RepID=A0AAV1S0T1_9ROSI|nr:unnamed protein product [Dovyalis caffra]
MVEDAVSLVIRAALLTDLKLDFFVVSYHTKLQLCSRESEYRAQLCKLSYRVEGKDVMGKMVRKTANSVFVQRLNNAERESLITVAQNHVADLLYAHGEGKQVLKLYSARCIA